MQLQKRKEQGSAEQALLIKRSGVPFKDLDITQAENLANMANDGDLDVDSLQAFVATDSSDLRNPATVTSARTIKKLRKSQQKKETQKALAEARDSSSSTATQSALSELKGSSGLTVDQSATEQDAASDNSSSNTPTQETFYRTSTQAQGTSEYSAMEASALDVASAGVQHTSTEEPNEDLSVEVSTPVVAPTVKPVSTEGLDEDTPAEIQKSVMSSTEVQLTPARGANEDLPAITLSPDDFSTEVQIFPIRGTSGDLPVEILPPVLPIASPTVIQRTSIEATSEDLPAEITSPILPITSSTDAQRTPTEIINKDLPSEITSPILSITSSTDIQRTPTKDTGEDHSAEIILPILIAPSTDLQRCSAVVDPTGSLPSFIDTPGDGHADSPILSGTAHSEGLAKNEQEIPTEIDYGIDGLGYPTPAPLDKVATGGSKNLIWTYATHTAYDDELRRAGVWLFEKPKGHFKAQPESNASQELGAVKAPVIVLPTQGPARNPMKNFDGDYLHITAHGRVRNDIRSLPSHPDFMTAEKLSEYQAAEVSGEKIWRHDRDLLNCRLAGCLVQIADSNAANIICLGCGPKTIIRYCSVQHLIADLKEHWRECSHNDLVIKHAIDYTTEPLRFSLLCPGLKDQNGFKSYANHRQKVYAQITYGHYTLFDFEDESPLTLLWPEDDPNKAEMESRIERTLNLALFNHTAYNVLVYLYKLLRECLQKKSGWVIGTQHAVKIQFQQEFNFDPTTNDSATNEKPLCECEWVGIHEMTKKQHLDSCKKWSKRGKNKRMQSMKEHIESMEAKYWILRVWRQQHPTATHWRERAVGKSFPGVDYADYWEPFMGAGWEGYGTEEDTIWG